MKIRDLAVKEVHSVTPDTSLTQVASMMRRHNIGVVPVCEDQQLVGMLTDRDIVIGCVATSMDPNQCRVGDYMTSNPVTITPEYSIEDAARLMAKEQIRRLPVVEDDRLIGMLSLGDISNALPCEDNLVAGSLRSISSPTHAVPVC